MKISDIGFLKTEPNLRQNSKTENSGFRGSIFKKPNSAVWLVFHVVSFTIHLAA